MILLLLQEAWHQNKNQIILKFHKYIDGHPNRKNWKFIAI
jgi:hypothetical protein